MTRLKRKRQRERQNIAAFADLLHTPANAVVTIPANGSFAIVTPSAHIADIAATIVGPTSRQIGTPAMQAAGHRLIGRIERGAVVTLAAWADLYVDVGLGRFQKICSGS